MSKNIDSKPDFGMELALRLLVSSQKITVKIKKERDKPKLLCYVHNV